MEVRQHGFIKNYNPERGFGFILQRGKPDTFFHFSAVENLRDEADLAPGVELEFSIAEVRGRTRAIDVRIVSGVR